METLYHFLDVSLINGDINDIKKGGTPFDVPPFKLLRYRLFN